MNNERPASDATPAAPKFRAKNMRLKYLRLDRIPVVRDRRVRYLLKLIHTDLSRPYTPAMLAEKVNLSSRQVRELFRQEFGCTPQQYLYQLRMQTAERLLVTSFDRVKTVAANVGFNDMTTFIREFKSVYGASPGVYRNDAPIELLVMSAHGA